MSRLTPAVDKRILIFLAGLMWMAVGTMLLRMAYIWLGDAPVPTRRLLASAGIAAALLIHHFGFLRIVDKNLGRIIPMQGRRCVFAFMSWKSYLLVAGMAAMGLGLRHSSLPKPYLSVVYIGIGLALILSSIRYLRILLGQLMEQGP